MLDQLSSEKFKKHSSYVNKIIDYLFNSWIWDKLAFKWWTLAYLCYNLDRYSTDIDLDLLDHKFEEEIKDTITKILWRIWEIKNTTWWRDLHRWIFRYDEHSMNIKIELNKRDLTWNTYENKIINWTNICCMDKETMTTNKLLALWTRRYNRDLYDTCFFRKQWFEYKEEIIENRIWMWLKDFIMFVIKDIPKQFDTKSILADWMWDVLTDNQKKWVKEFLINETINELEKYIKW